MNCTIVEATQEHLDGIEILYRQFVYAEWEMEPRPKDRLVKPDDRLGVVSRMLDQFDHPEKTWLVALDGRSVVGTLLLSLRIGTFVKGKQGRLDLIVVDPKYQRQGIGFSLMTHARRLAESLECEWMGLEVLDVNIAAANLYKKAGYAPISTRMLNMLDK